jgi:hypothetical protein
VTHDLPTNAFRNAIGLRSLRQSEDVLNLKEVEKFFNNSVDKMSAPIRPDPTETTITSDYSQQTVRCNSSGGGFDGNEFRETTEAADRIKYVGILEVVARKGPDEIDC